MSALETLEWRCINCGEFHEYGQWKCYDLRWENQPRTCWEGYENSNSWNSPHHQYYGKHEQQLLEQDEPHQRQGSNGKKSIEELLESFLVQQENINKRQDAAFNNNEVALRNLETQIQELSMLFEESNQVSPLREEVISLEEQDEELQIEENETCDLIEESLIPLVLEEDVEVELPKAASEVVFELECEKMVDEREEQVVECAELKEVLIVDFVFRDKLMINEERPPRIRIYLMNSWNKGVQGKEQARGNIFGSTWNQIRENFFNPLIIHVINLAMIFEIGCSILMELGQNLHDLSGLKQFAIDPG